jgi:hypothetical protein
MEPVPIAAVNALRCRPASQARRRSATRTRGDRDDVRCRHDPNNAQASQNEGQQTLGQSSVKGCEQAPCICSSSLCQFRPYTQTAGEPFHITCLTRSQLKQAAGYKGKGRGRRALSRYVGLASAGRIAYPAANRTDDRARMSKGRTAATRTGRSGMVGSAEIDAMVARTAPAVLALLKDGVPRAPRAPSSLPSPTGTRRRMSLAPSCGSPSPGSCSRPSASTAWCPWPSRKGRKADPEPAGR